MGHALKLIDAVAISPVPVGLGITIFPSWEVVSLIVNMSASGSEFAVSKNVFTPMKTGAGVVFVQLNIIGIS